MTGLLKPNRFRAYQLGNAGSSFSYFDGSEFTLIEARYNKVNAPNIHNEMLICGITEISVLHITSWDQDHCVPSQLEAIIRNLKPKKIEYPSYKPHTESGKYSLNIINELHRNAIQISPNYIEVYNVLTSPLLNKSYNFKYRDILYHPKFISEDSSNDNSTVKLFRSGSFNVLSLGDLENPQLAETLGRNISRNGEVDVMILAHHGADNGFTTSSFLDMVRPTVAIATSDYDNKFGHPKPTVQILLYQKKIPRLTTKTGDIIIHSTGKYSDHYTVANLIAGSTKVSSSFNRKAKKSNHLSITPSKLAKLKKYFQK
jgi:competence protein ComEC